MQFFCQDNRVGKVAHGLAQPAALASEMKVGFLFRETLTILKDAFGALNDFSGLQRSLHLQGFRHQSRVFDSKRSLARHGAGESRLFFRKSPSFVNVDIQRTEYSLGSHQRHRHQRYKLRYH
jgi:hypothetical protein